MGDTGLNTYSNPAWLWRNAQPLAEFPFCKTHLPCAAQCFWMCVVRDYLDIVKVAWLDIVTEFGSSLSLQAGLDRLPLQPHCLCVLTWWWVGWRQRWVTGLNFGDFRWRWFCCFILFFGRNNHSTLCLAGRAGLWRGLLGLLSLRWWWRGLG